MDHDFEVSGFDIRARMFKRDTSLIVHKDNSEHAKLINMNSFISIQTVFHSTLSTLHGH